MVNRGRSVQSHGAPAVRGGGSLHDGPDNGVCQEVMHHQDHGWTPVPAIPGALHVHLSDHLEVLSNGQLRSLVYWAILNTDEARVSIASIQVCSCQQPKAEH
ncbi:hypothetical protein QYE76_041712 [Lolium multiflorum]|uniref:Isopenicillin N synthase-like Fe(2+) 2OG dioxygenase domain-containing protein n=1 Tax=Lolium multiflorum TaxID=4521 RepID=A0AAD8TFI8_LOLMU|nr:hypothetical protein QYE76_041712 [Lolium multiflorum]